MCDCLVALGPATGDGHTLFAKNSDRPPREVQVLEWFEPRSETRTRTTYLEIEPHTWRHTAVSRVTPGVDVGGRAWRQRGRRGRRQRHHLHDTRPAGCGPRAHGHGSRAPRTRTRFDRRRGRRRHHSAARTSRTGRFGARERRPAVLVVVPRGRPDVGVRGRDQRPRLRSRDGRSCPGHVQPHHDRVVRQAAPPSPAAGRQAGRPSSRCEQRRARARTGDGRRARCAPSRSTSVATTATPCACTYPTSKRPERRSSRSCRSVDRRASGPCKALPAPTSTNRVGEHADRIRHRRSHTRHAAHQGSARGARVTK